MSTERKTVSGELKSDDSGTLTAVFSRFNVIDSDGDVTRPTAFDDGTDVIIGAFGHRTSEPPIGKGRIRVSPAVATVEGKLFLNTTHGRDAYHTLKELGPLGQWSYVFNVLQESRGDFEGKRVRFLEKVKVFSVDPVLAGAGIDTRTTSIKCSGCGGGDLSEGEKAELRQIAERAQVRAAFDEARGTLATLKAQDDARRRRELPGHLVPFATRWAAERALKEFASVAGAPLSELKWFAEDQDPRRLGWADVGRGIVWLRSDLPEKAAAWVAAHELGHFTEGGRADEDAANRFAHRVTGRTWEESL